MDELALVTMVTIRNCFIAVVVLQMFLMVWYSGQDQYDKKLMGHNNGVVVNLVFGLVGLGLSQIMIWVN
jgi:hypothetical protein